MGSFLLLLVVAAVGSLVGFVLAEIVDGLTERGW
jgi:hypothetical protein